MKTFEIYSLIRKGELKTGKYENEKYILEITTASIHGTQMWLKDKTQSFENYKNIFDRNPVEINKIMDLDWEKWIESVDVLTAIKARRKGKTIKCVYNGVTYKYDEESVNFYTDNQIINGAWYIVN